MISIGKVQRKLKNAGSHDKFGWKYRRDQLKMWDTTLFMESTKCYLTFNSFLFIYSESAIGVKTRKTKHGDLLWHNKTVPYIISDHGKSA